MSAERGRQKPRAEMSVVVLDHIEERGMKAEIEQGLIVWNNTVGKYELTAFGHKRLEEYRHKNATGV